MAKRDGENVTCVNDSDWLAGKFEEQRDHLTSVAYRMLGSRAEAEDAVQEAWIRANRAGTDDVGNLGGWLTTIVARICLDALRSRKARREEPVDDQPAPAFVSEANDPEREAILSDSVGAALMIVLDTLTPSERVAFVLHDLFDVPFEHIAPLIDKSVVAARQLASRARRRVRGITAPADQRAREEVVSAFLTASRDGNFEALLTLLDPAVVLRADNAALAMGAQDYFGLPALGAQAVAKTFSGRARAAQPVLIDGVPGLVWVQGGATRVVFAFTIEERRITSIELIADPQRIGAMTIEF